jgi:hypothetical protein
MAEHTFTLFAHTHREHASTSTQIVTKLQRFIHPFPPWEESRRRRRRCFATICGAAARKQKFVWRRGDEFDRLI